MVRKIRVHVKSYYKPSIGKRVKSYSYFRRDTGKPGRTPKQKRWFKPTKPKGRPFLNNWSKDQGEHERMMRLKGRHASRMRTDLKYKQEVKKEAERKGIPMVVVGQKRTWKDVRALSNVTTDTKTKTLARKDSIAFMKWMRRTYKSENMRKSLATR